MIQIQRPEQFAKAAGRARKERMFVRRTGERRYDVTNRKNSHRYTVNFYVMNGKRFGECNCEAGMPMHGNHVPLVCKHLAAALSLHLALAAQKHVGH